MVTDDKPLALYTGIPFDRSGDLTSDVRRFGIEKDLLMIGAQDLRSEY